MCVFPWIFVGTGRGFLHSAYWKEILLRAGMPLMQFCFFRKNMHKDLFLKCNKMRKKENKPLYQSWVSFQAAFLARSVAQSLLSIWMPWDTPPVAFPFACCRVRAFIICIMELNHSFWLARRKDSLNTHHLWEREVIMEQLNLWEQASGFLNTLENNEY